MTDPLLSRLDKYVIGLLDEAERPDCDAGANGDTQEASEEGPGSFRRASLKERVDLLRAATAYMNLRAGKAAEPEPEEPPEIDGFVTRLRPNNGRARRR